MKRAKIFAAVIYALLVMGTMTFVHFPELRADETQAKIGVEQARETALRAVPGTVKNDYLATHHGRLIYSFEIAPAAQHGYFANVSLYQRGIVEVNVNALDGSVVNVHRKHEARKDQVQCAEIRSESAPPLSAGRFRPFPGQFPARRRWRSS